MNNGRFPSKAPEACHLWTCHDRLFSNKVLEAVWNPSPIESSGQSLAAPNGLSRQNRADERCS